MSTCTSTLQKYTIYRFSQDIVACRSPVDPNLLVCKRLVAKEGDRIKWHRLSRVCGGFLSPALFLPTLAYCMHWQMFKVPRGHVWLLGDNADRSTDSRVFGAVPQGLVSCRLVYRVSHLIIFLSLSLLCAAFQIWPPSRIGSVSTHWFFEREENEKE